MCVGPLLEVLADFQFLDDQIGFFLDLHQDVKGVGFFDRGLGVNFLVATGTDLVVDDLADNFLADDQLSIQGTLVKEHYLYWNSAPCRRLSAMALAIIRKTSIIYESARSAVLLGQQAADLGTHIAFGEHDFGFGNQLAVDSCETVLGSMGVSSAAAAD